MLETKIETHYDTVRKYLRISKPRRLETAPRARPVLERVAPRLEELMEEWSLRTTRKQRITGDPRTKTKNQEPLAGVACRSHGGGRRQFTSCCHYPSPVF